MILLKCCTQYVSKLGKLSSGHRTGKGQFPFQSPKRAMTENVPTTIQLHPFNILAKLCSKFFKIGLSSVWIENFQMYKLSLEKANEPENKLPTFIGSWRKQGNSREKKEKKTSISAFLGYAKDFACVDHRNLWNILKYVGVPYHLTYLLRSLYVGQ